MFELQRLNNQLVVLRLSFDKAITEGSSFEEVKKIYMEIKDVEKQIVASKISHIKDGRTEDN